MKKTVFALLPLLAAGSIQAAAITQLKAFISGTSTLTADFHQVVIAKDKRNEASGTL